MYIFLNMKMNEINKYIFIYFSYTFSNNNNNIITFLIDMYLSVTFNVMFIHNYFTHT